MAATPPRAGTAKGGAGAKPCTAEATRDGDDDGRNAAAATAPPCTWIELRAPAWLLLPSFPQQTHLHHRILAHGHAMPCHPMRGSQTHLPDQRLRLGAGARVEVLAAATALLPWRRRLRGCLPGPPYVFCVWLREGNGFVLQGELPGLRGLVRAMCLIGQGARAVSALWVIDQAEARQSVAKAKAFQGRAKVLPASVLNITTPTAMAVAFAGPLLTGAEGSHARTGRSKLHCGGEYSAGTRNGRRLSFMHARRVCARAVKRMHACRIV